MTFSRESFAAAKPNAKGIFFNHGRHYGKVELELCKMQQSAQNPSLMNFIAEFKVLESSDPETPVGARRTYIVSSKHASADSNVKTFIGACVGESFERTNWDHVCAAVSEQQPLRGTILALDTRRVATRAQATMTKEQIAEGRGWYTYHSWTLVEMSPMMRAA